MPELPEVEIVTRALSRKLKGRSILEHRVHHPGVLLHDPHAGLGGPLRRFERGERHGKYMVLKFSSEQRLVVHLRMTGAFYFRDSDTPLQPHTHVEFQLDTGEWLAYRDPRRFGRIWWLSPNSSTNPLADLGPDALRLSQPEWVARISERSRMMKPLLLDQAVIAGLGNIYVDELLHRSRIHPQRAADSIPAARLGEMWSACRELLRLAIRNGGSSIRSFVDTDGILGNYQNFHLVYAREGEPCTTCGTLIKRIVVAQRGTWICPRCQRRR